MSTAAPHLPSTVRELTVESDDGTLIRAWTNDAPGPTVLLCNGLGASPYAWPALLRPDCGVRVVSWFHRGIGGSERPRDVERVGVDADLEDALAVMRHTGIERATVAGWSIGVNHAFELAVRWPDKVDGVFAVAGVPGDTFATMLGPAHLPGPVARTATVGLARMIGFAGPVVTPVAHRLHHVPFFFDAVRHSGFVLPRADRQATSAALRAFLAADWHWYMHLARHASRHERVRLSAVTQPVTLLSARWDVLAGVRQMRSAADRIADARYVELNASHFVTLEHPAEVHAELLALVRRTGARPL